MDAPTPQDLLNTDGVTFLTTVFEPGDLFLSRPIEAWNEGKLRRSRVDYKHQRYLKADREALLKVFPEMLKESAKEKTNQFFGVCARFGGGERYDLASQIRVVRVLWADIDNVTMEERAQNEHLQSQSHRKCRTLMPFAGPLPDLEKGKVRHT